MIQERHIDDTSAEKIARAYLEYQFREGEKSIFSLLGDEKAVIAYLKAGIKTLSRCGWLHRSEGGEAWIAIDFSDDRVPFSAMLSNLAQAVRAVGLCRLARLAKLRNGDRKPLAAAMRRAGKPFVHVEMLCVLPQWQKQGWMRRLTEYAFSIADERGLDCVLETDESAKAEMYMHLGMRLAQIRRVSSEIAFYDLIREQPHS